MCLYSFSNITFSSLSTSLFHFHLPLLSFVIHFCTSFLPCFLSSSSLYHLSSPCLLLLYRCPCSLLQQSVEGPGTVSVCLNKMYNTESCSSSDPSEMLAGNLLRRRRRPTPCLASTAVLTTRSPSLLSPSLLYTCITITHLHLLSITVETSQRN